MIDKEVETKAILLAFKVALKEYIGLTERQWTDLLRLVNIELTRIINKKHETEN